MQRWLSRIDIFGVALGLVLMAVSSAAVAQSYHRSNLVSNLSGKAAHMDPLLKNPWGLVYGPGAPFWVSDEASGWSTLYDGAGNPQSLQVVIPPKSGTGKGTPTGIVYNGSQEFKIQNWVSAFLFATLDGTISGWSTFSPNNALIGVTQAGASRRLNLALPLPLGTSSPLSRQKKGRDAGVAVCCQNENRRTADVRAVLADVSARAQ